MKRPSTFAFFALFVRQCWETGTLSDEFTARDLKEAQTVGRRSPNAQTLSRNLNRMKRLKLLKRKGFESEGRTRFAKYAATLALLSKTDAALLKLSRKNLKS